MGVLGAGPGPGGPGPRSEDAAATSSLSAWRSRGLGDWGRARPGFPSPSYQIGHEQRGNG